MLGDVYKATEPVAQKETPSPEKEAYQKYNDRLIDYMEILNAQYQYTTDKQFRDALSICERNIRVAAELDASRTLSPQDKLEHFRDTDRTLCWTIGKNFGKSLRDLGASLPSMQPMINPELVDAYYEALAGGRYFEDFLYDQVTRPDGQITFRRQASSIYEYLQGLDRKYQEDARYNAFTHFVRLALRAMEDVRAIELAQRLEKEALENESIADNE